jgi:phospho-N-acetylmuramoyl-pentapeptide-transferase
VILLLIAAASGLILSIFTTPVAIGVLRRRSIGQFIQEEVTGHAHKQGTPTMGGVVLVGAVAIGYLFAHLQFWTPSEGFALEWRPFGAGGWLALFAMAGMGVVGFLDDYIKFAQRRSLGLNKRAKFGLQLLIAGTFAWGASAAGVSTQLSFVRPLGLDLGVFFVAWVLFLLTGAANGVNLSDGMDGLAAGSAALVVGAYTIIAFWQFRYSPPSGTVYPASVDPLEVAVVSAAMLGALLGFLWWNAPPAQVFMGDVGSQAIGGLLAAMAILTNTHLLLAVLGAIYVAETLSVIVQVLSFRVTGNRIFRMTPVHYHFDLAGWPETTVVIRFWILTGIGVALGLGLFYADFLSVEGILR